MSFKNLEERFNANVEKLYAGSTQKFAGGKSSNGKADDPLITRGVGIGYFGKNEDRSVPIESTKQDVRRLTLFQLSPRGIKFLAKQQTLQLGNTFEFTRVVNPTFVVGNAVPFIHVKRNLKPINELVGKTDRSDNNVRKMGQLQVSTYNALKEKSLNPTLVKDNSGLKRFGKALFSSLLGPLKSVIDTARGTISALNPLQDRNIREKGWTKSRPELETYYKVLQVELIKNQQKAFNDVRSGIAWSIVPTTDQYASITNPIARVTSEPVIQYIRYFDRGESLGTGKPGTTEPSSYTAKRGSGGYLPENPRASSGNISYIRDKSNDLAAGQKLNTAEVYKDINNSRDVSKTGWEDVINVSFAMGKEDPIRFRAFIKDINQSTTPQYNTFQYIGRIEKFVTYTGVQREVSLKLAVIAFSIHELDMVWKRINYLTGLAFPYGFNSGILQPNIARITVGKLYDNQPVYLTSLNTVFNDTAESWEIDPNYQVPIAATMDMKFVLVENQTKIASSPFYGITDSKLGFRELPTRIKAGTNEGADGIKSTRGVNVGQLDVNKAMGILRSQLSSTSLPKPNNNAPAAKIPSTKTSTNPIVKQLSTFGQKPFAPFNGEKPKIPSLADIRLNQSFSNLKNFTKPSVNLRFPSIPSIRGR